MQIHRAAQTGVFYLPNKDLTALQYFSDDPHQWQIHYRYQLLKMVYDKLSLNHRRRIHSLSRTIEHDHPILFHIMGRFIPIDPFEIQDQEDLDFYAQDFIEEFWSTFCHELVRFDFLFQKWKIFSRKSFPKWQTTFLDTVVESLQDPVFCAGLPRTFFSRIALWIDLVEDMQRKQHEKSQLLQSFEQDFRNVLTSLELKCLLSKYSVLIPIYLEWAISVFHQHIKPLRPCSSKKILQWAAQTNKFIDWSE